MSEKTLDTLSESERLSERQRLHDQTISAIFDTGFGEWYENLFAQYFRLTEPLTLLPHQHDIYNKFRAQMEDKKLVIDLSELGSGKSYVVLKLAIDMDFTVLYVSNELAVKTMNSLMCRYGVRHLYSLSFNDVTAIDGRTSNMYITNRDGVRTINGNYKRLLQEKKILVVIDEVQAGKNGDAQRSEAIRLMLSPIYFPHRYGIPDNGSRVSLLSGTLFDCKEHALQMVYLTNFCGSCDYTSVMYHTSNGTVTYLDAGFGELVFNCFYVNPQLTSEIVGGVSFNERGIPQHIGKPFMSNYIDMVYEMFSRIILPYYAHGISKPPCSYPKKGRNIVRELTPEQENRMMQFLYSNRNQFRFEDGVISFSDKSSKFRSSLHEMLHHFKAEHIVQEVINELLQGMKSVIYTDYDASTQYIVDTLRSKGWNVLCITGEVKQQQRYTNIGSFNEEKDVNVIVCKKSIASCSINLHCKKTIEEGGEIRTLHMIPSFDSTQILQSLERVDRAERATEVHVNVWWLKSGQEILQKIEENLYTNLATKINVIKRVSLLQEFGIERDFFTDYPFC